MQSIQEKKNIVYLTNVFLPNIMNRFGLFDKIANINENIKNDIFLSEYVILRTNHMSRKRCYFDTKISSNNYI